MFLTHKTLCKNREQASISEVTLTRIHVESILRVIVDNFKNYFFSANSKTGLICSNGPHDDDYNRTEVSPCPARLRINMTSEAHFTLTSLSVSSTPAMSTSAFFLSQVFSTVHMISSIMK